MRKLKRWAVVVAAFCLAASLGGCSTGDTVSYKEMNSATREELVKLVGEDDRLPDEELENKTIKWLQDWDLNADSTGKSTPPELAIFQDRYGGEVQWYQCTYEERYDKLANYINSDEGIDFFYGGNFDAFPKGAIRDMFVPFDDYIDLDSELWKDVKELNDSIMWKGAHYMAVVEMTGDNCAVIYNKDTVQELGFDDPAELFEKGEWDWDAFEEMLEAFVDVENGKYGLDGWWFESGLSATVGVPYVDLVDGELVSNLGDPNIARVQNFMYDLNTKGLVAIGVGDFGWKDKPEYIGEGKEIFYPAGLWKLYGERDRIDPKTNKNTGWAGVFGEHVMFVPMPKDPDADAYYIPANLNSYLFVKGGHNPEGVARWLDCKRLTFLNEDIRALADQQFLDDYHWTDEMVEMKNQMDALAMANPVIDFKTGVTADLEDILDSSEGVRAAGKGTPWNETLSSLKEPVQAMIDEANNS